MACSGHIVLAVACLLLSQARQLPLYAGQAFPELVVFPLWSMGTHKMKHVVTYSLPHLFNLFFVWLHEFRVDLTVLCDHGLE